MDCFHLVPASKHSTKLCDIYLMVYVQSWTPDDGWEDRPIYVEWYSINSKIVHLVGFTIELCFRFSPIYNSQLCQFHYTEYKWIVCPKFCPLWGWSREAISGGERVVRNVSFIRKAASVFLPLGHLKSPIDETRELAEEALVATILANVCSYSKHAVHLWEAVPEHGALLQCLQWIWWPPICMAPLN